MMRLFSLGFAGGALLLQQQASLPTWRAALLLAAVWCGLLLLQGLRLPGRTGSCWRTGRAYGGAVLLGVSVGFCWAALQAQLALAPALHRDDEGQDVGVTGLIESLPYPSGQGMRFNFRIEQTLTPTHGALPVHVALGWYAPSHGKDRAAMALNGSDLPQLHAGQRWQLTLRLQRPHGNANPASNDYEVWLLEQGLRATGYVRRSPQPRLLADFVPCASCVVAAMRGALRQRIEMALAGRRYAGVIVALVVGDQHGISQQDWLVFTRTGISHLISISGLHVTMVAGLAALVAGRLWRCSWLTRAQLPLYLPAQKCAALVGALVGLAYVLLAGFGVPAQRTLYMLCMVALAIWTGRIGSISHVLAAALLLVLIIDPWAVLWPGFWLSFGAVAVLVYAGSGRLQLGERAQDEPSAERAKSVARWRWLQRWGPKLAQAAQAQYAVTVGLVPLTLVFFAQCSLVTPCANALAIPLVSLLIAPLALLASILPQPVCTVLLVLAHALFSMLAAVLAWLAQLPLAVWRAPAPPLALLLWAVLGTLWLLAPRGWPMRWLGLVSWIPLLLARPPTPRHGALQVTVFDVGQGMAVLLETAQHRMLYDAGPAYGAQSDAASRVILPYLQARGIATLDRLMVSHSDTDHAGGALALLAAMPQLALWSSLPPGHAVRRAAHTALACAAGQHWEWDGVRFELLHPALASYHQPGIKPNALSCSLRVSTPAGSLLLVGDIEAPQEQRLVGEFGSSLRSTVLLAPHHGSLTSSTSAFLQAVQPRHALFQLGYRNRYHHPHAAVWQRYGELGIQRWRTDETGAITLSFDEDIRISAYRQQHARYWYGH